MKFKDLKVLDGQNFKIVKSSDYNMTFKKFSKDGRPDGELVRWGKDPIDDPDYGPAPEILDIEISAGKCSSNCPMCYKNSSSNSPLVNMSLETYKLVLDKITASRITTQVALGLTSVKDNPDFLDIMRYTRKKGLIPNFTLSGNDHSLDLDFATQLAELCGALAVSATPWNMESAFDTVKLFVDLGVEQTNIHVVVSKETMYFVNKVIETRMSDPRLENMGAVVGLMVKPKGRAKGNFNPPGKEEYKKLVNKALENEIPIGFDSCSCAHFLNSVQDHPNLDNLIMSSDACESTLFSYYVNVFGQGFPCSFAENTPGWEQGLDILTCDDFIKDIWLHSRTREFRNNLLATTGQNDISCRECPIYSELLLDK
jgi:MoaA/NifB/PqqE/SkfB family radical SAM enzyme